MDTRLLGRDRELAVLDDAIAKLMRGERSLVMLSGEPGIGKTRLLDELTARAASRGAAVAWGRALEVGITPAYWPWIEALGALAVTGDRPPSLADSGIGLGGDRSTDGQGARLAMVEQVLAFLARRAAVAPVALVFDDVHAADLSSLQLLERVAPRARVLIAIAARDGDADREVATVLGRIQRGAHRLSLARLERDHVAALVGDRANAARVWELTEGNPLFVTELVAAGGALPQVSSVRSVIRDRIARLPVATGEALVAGAVVGREFRGRVVAAMLEHAADGVDGSELATGRREVATDLAPAVRVGLVLATGADRYRFSHALVAEALIDSHELDGPARVRLHLTAARALEQHEPDNVAAIAHHLLAAGHREAVAAAERAAARARAQLAFEDAAALLERALGALGPDRARRAALLCAQAEALQHASQHARAAALCDDAAAIARELGDAEMLARIALVRGLEWRFGRTDPVLVGALREALALRPHDAKLLARLAAAEQPAADPRGPITAAWEAIELARALPPRDRLDVMYVATAALMDYLAAGEIQPVLEETLALARGVDRWISVHTRLRMAFVAMTAIDLVKFDIAVAEFTAEAEALALPRWLRHVDMLAAMRAALAGRFDDDDRHIAALEERSVGDANTLWTLQAHRLFVAATRTQPITPEMWAAIGRHPTAPTVMDAWIATLAGDREAAAAAIAGDILRIDDPDLLVMAGQAIAFVGDRERAAKLYPLVDRWSGRIVVTSMVGCSVLDVCDRVLLVLATVLEDWDAVERHAERALAIANKLASPVWRTRIRSDWADALDKRGDAARARELRALALPDAERLGMTGVIARCAGVTAAPPARSTITIARAGELWLVSGFGEVVHVKDSRGMQMLARLVGEPGREVHALELGAGGDAVDGGDAGELLDARAKQMYRARLAELIAERDEAEEFCDAGRLERASTEIEALTAELSRAVGLGGRDRKAGAAGERARVNVQRRVNHALQVIRAVSPRIGEHLAATIRTGTYCIYDVAS